jgi:hypothetical protein
VPFLFECNAMSDVTRPIVLVLAVLLAIAVVVSVGWYISLFDWSSFSRSVQSAEDQPNVGAPAPQGNGLRLQLTPVGEPRRDRLVLRLDVTNIEKVPISWDKECSVFLEWKLVTPDGRQLVTTDVAQLEREDTRQAGTRFVPLLPGQTFSKEIELTRSFRQFVSGHSAHTAGVVHQTVGYEAMVRVQIPQRIDSLEVSVEYNLGMDGAGGFWSWFGVKHEDVRLQSHRAESNVVTVRLK